MNKAQLLKRIDALNRRIDLHILNGRPYVKESREHKAILRLLAII